MIYLRKQGTQLSFDEKTPEGKAKIAHYRDRLKFKEFKPEQLAKEAKERAAKAVKANAKPTSNDKPNEGGAGTVVSGEGNKPNEGGVGDGSDVS